MSDPVYKQYPTLYAFNTKTKKHMLKSGRACKKAYAANPEHFVESATMFQTRIVAVPPVAINPEPVAINPGPVTSNPEPPHPQEDPSITKQRELIQQLIRQEIKQNSKPYEGKSSAELDLLFRQLLVAKLLKSAEGPNTINKFAKPAKATAKKPQLKFKLRAPQISEDEEDEDEEFDTEK